MRKQPGQVRQPSELQIQIGAMFDRLSDTERQILRLRFGINGQAPQPIKKIADYMDMPTHQVKRVIQGALQEISGRPDGTIH